MNVEHDQCKRCDGEHNIYRCPMHPEVYQHKQGTCSKCGMALEKEVHTVSVVSSQYTCPMHPEIIQDHVGNCPKCGMALEPMAVETIEDDRDGRAHV